MKATGIVRKIDDLGRIVIPKEIRRTMRLSEGTPLEIFTDREGGVILKKYSPMADLGNFARQYAESLASSLNRKAAVCDRDQFIAAAGGGKKDLLGKPISRELEELIVNRETSGRPGKGDPMIPLTEGDDGGYSAQIIYPILAEGDSAGAVILYSREPQAGFSESEQKAAACAALFLGSQMEG